MNRRGFLKNIIAGALALPVIGSSLNAFAKACKPIPESLKKKVFDPSDKKNEKTAKRLAFEVSSSKPDQNCGNCKQLKGKAGEDWGKCPFVGMKYVSSCSWCNKWAKK